MNLKLNQVVNMDISFLEDNENSRKPEELEFIAKNMILSVSSLNFKDKMVVFLTCLSNLNEELIDTEQKTVFQYLTLKLLKEYFERD
jgi:chromatin segregation and condensation protein Rec8/ScpA/Scc1 (kleisin family)